MCDSSCSTCTGNSNYECEGCSSGYESKKYKVRYERNKITYNHRFYDIIHLVKAINIKIAKEHVDRVILLVQLVPETLIMTVMHVVLSMSQKVEVVLRKKQKNLDPAFVMFLHNLKLAQIRMVNAKWSFFNLQVLVMFIQKKKKLALPVNILEHC